MAKLKNVTDAELTEAEVRALALTQTVHDLLNRASQGYADPIEMPLSMAATFLGSSRSLADLAHFLLVKGVLQETRAKLETELRKASDREVG